MILNNKQKNNYEYTKNYKMWHNERAKAHNGEKRDVPGMGNIGRCERWELCR